MDEILALGSSDFEVEIALRVFSHEVEPVKKIKNFFSKSKNMEKNTKYEPYNENSENWGEKTEFKNLKISGILGQGSFGIVYYAKLKQKEEEMEFAVKSIKKNLNSKFQI